jgi:hypothetical protein
VTVLGRGPRRLVAPDGTTVVIRSFASTDSAALADLYRHLPAAEWVSHLGVCEANDRGFAVRAASVADRGGRGLVAEVRAPSPDDQVDRAPGEVSRAAVGGVVGEAHYELLPDGDGELALVVAPEWRDWLGPRLFDAVLDEAASSGVANLVVDVMRTDEWMRELIGARGHAVLPTDDWLSTRMVVGTQGCTPVWGDAPGPRVLVEAPGGRWHAADAARAAGLAVMGCTAPGDPGAVCPMSDGRPCPLVTGADVIVVSYPPDRPEWDEVLVTHRRMHPDVPVCVEGRARRPVPDGVVALDVHDPAAVVRRVAELAATRVAERSAHGAH